MEALAALMIFGGVLWLAVFVVGKFTADERAREDAPTPSPPLPTDTKPLFNLTRDARGSSPLFGFPVIFSSKLDADKHPNVVTGLTLNRDYVAIRRGSYGVKAFLLDESLTLGVSPGCPPGFHENSDYMIELESETEVARFPISFGGWLQIVDAARRGGSTIEVDADLPAHLKDLVETVLPGDEDIKPVRTKARGSKQETPREVGRCKACGAGIGRKSSCDYCGASQ
jgi:hypothetical protein